MNNGSMSLALVLDGKKTDAEAQAFCQVFTGHDGIAFRIVRDDFGLRLVTSTEVHKGLEEIKQFVEQFKKEKLFHLHRQAEVEQIAETIRGSSS